MKEWVDQCMNIMLTPSYIEPIFYATPSNLHNPTF